MLNTAEIKSVHEYRTRRDQLTRPETEGGGRRFHRDEERTERRTVGAASIASLPMDVCFAPFQVVEVDEAF